MIVGRVLGEKWAAPMTIVLGALEIMLGLWVISGTLPIPCVLIQTFALVGMNTLEIAFAKDLLISAPGMVALNLVFLGLAWFSALAG
jgi:hypothetical protein